MPTSFHFPACLLFIPFSENSLVNFVCFLEQEVRKMVYWVLRNSFAELYESLRQVRHNVIHEILSDWLRSLVQKVSFLLSQFFQLGHIFLINNPLLLLLLPLQFGRFLQLNLQLFLLLLLLLDQHRDLVHFLLLIELSLAFFSAFSRRVHIKL